MPCGKVIKTMGKIDRPFRIESLIIFLISMGIIVLVNSHNFNNSFIRLSGMILFFIIGFISFVYFVDRGDL